MPATATDLTGRIAAELDDLTRIRRDIHRHPEMRFQEHRTSRLVQDELTRLGIAFVADLAGHEPGTGTGVLAHLPATTANHGPCVALRADMDALPITESTAKPYSSTNPGVMHACGHDGHTTILLGAARILASLEHRPNPVTFLFQPAEEGGAGGEKMCRDGALTGGPRGTLGPPVSRIYGLHGWPGLDLNRVGTRPGPLLAATDEIRVTITGRQAHAAYPHLGVDPIVAAAHVITAAQTIVSRTVSPLDAVVVTFGSVHAGTTNNVIPAAATLHGTIRTLTPDTRTHAKATLARLVEQVSAAMGCHGEMVVEEGYPVTLNDPAEAQRVLDTARAATLPAGVDLVPQPSMGGEDFSYYAQLVPACFFLIGLKPLGAERVPQLHQPDFDFPDEALGVGIEMMCRLALS